MLVRRTDVGHQQSVKTSQPRIKTFVFISN